VKTLPKYLLFQVVASLAMTVLVFTFVLLLGNALKELLPLLVNHQASLIVLAKAMGLLIPFVGTFALPISMLTATLLVFGRFSADQELTAARASGVSLLSLIMPVLVLSLVLCAVSAAVNLEIGPRCRVAYNSLRFGLRATVFSKLQLPEGRSINTFPGYLVFVGKNRGTNLHDVLLFQLKDETNILLSGRAPRGSIEIDKENQKLRLHLYDSTIQYVAGNMAGVGSEFTRDLDLGPGAKYTQKTGLSDMTFGQLRDELERWETRVRMRPEQLTPEALRIWRAQLDEWSNLTEPIRVQIHRQVAFSFACFSFVLVGIPLGIRVQRRETNVGIAIALALVAIYYALIILANSQSTHAELVPHLWIWAPNFLFQAVGTVLLWRANRGM
jgi:lipopolysaccharide export system permease protein